MALEEYVAFYLRRRTVERTVEWLESAVAWLDSSGSSTGVSATLLRELRQALNRDRHREALTRIEEALGDLGDGDALEGIARIVEDPTALRAAVERLESAGVSGGA